MPNQTKEENNLFEKITWDTLEKWAGKKVLSRGKSYQRRGAVENLGQLEENDIIATVQGSEPYVTRVSVSGTTLKSECTCPYGSECKHAIAVILEYIDCLKHKKIVERIQKPENDSRVLALEHEFADNPLDDEAWVDQEEESPNTFHETSRSITELKNILQSQSKKELIDLCLDLAKSMPKAQQFFLDQDSLTSGNIKKITAVIKRELLALQTAEWPSSNYGYGRYSSGYSQHSANLDRLLKSLQELSHLKKLDDLIHWGPQLLEAGNHAIPLEPEGESSDDISACLEVIINALPSSSLQSPDQLIWAIDMDLMDEYSLCHHALASVFEKKQTKKCCSVVADHLFERLANLKTKKNKSDFNTNYARDNLCKWIAYALNNAGRNNEVTQLYEKEVTITQNYNRLVEHLIQEKQWTAATQYCFTGIKTLRSSPDGYPENLYKQLEDIYETTDNLPQLAALTADAFFNTPNLNNFKQLIHIGKRLKEEKSIDAWARFFLETGLIPNSSESNHSKDAPNESWPIQLPEAPPRSNQYASKGPTFDTLIDIALSENKPHDIIKWYDLKQSQKNRSSFYSSVSNTQIAEAVKSLYPERAIQIWKGIAQANIDQASPRGYDAAEPFLKKIKSLMKTHKMDTQWNTLMATLCEQNKRRPRCMAVLHRVELGEKPIFKAI